MSVGGLVKNRMYFGTLLAGVDHLPHTLDLERNRFSKGQPEHGAELADHLERLVALHDASTIAAVIVEPVAGSVGVYPPPKGYLERLREITERHGILLIFDEVITAYGRLGKGSAAEYFGVIPDLVTTAKGLTSGTVPMGAVMARRHVHDASCHGTGRGARRRSSCSTATPTPPTRSPAPRPWRPWTSTATRACSSAPRSSPPTGRSGCIVLRDHPNVIDIRNIGLMGAIELSPRPGKPGERGYDAIQKAADKGLLARTTGDTIALSPPLVVRREQIDEIVRLVGETVEELE
jgi:beta-alanine--pyruvate transaminase